MANDGSNPNSRANLRPELGQAAAGKWKKGQSGNPGGKVSVQRDLERAKAIGVPPDILAAIAACLEVAAVRLAELGAEGFVMWFQSELESAARRVLPLDLAEARAMWWRTILPVCYAGPQRIPDPNWTHASQEVGVRLLGKPREHVVLEGPDAAPIDWSKVPAAEREGILAAIQKLQAYVGEPESATEH